MTRPDIVKAGLALAPIVLGVAAAGSGCAKLSPDAGMGVVESAEPASSARTWPSSTVSLPERSLRPASKELLSRRLTTASAVQIALLNHRGLQAAYNDLGISEAQTAEASLPPPPRSASVS